jgi:hypothetical protein
MQNKEFNRAYLIDTQEFSIKNAVELRSEIFLLKILLKRIQQLVVLFLFTTKNQNLVNVIFQENKSFNFSPQTLQNSRTNVHRKEAISNPS